MSGSPASSTVQAGERGWSASGDTPTTVVLVRHGVTEHTVDKRFSGGLAGTNPPLSQEGRTQARALARWLAPLGEDEPSLVSSPVRRARETAEELAAVWGRPVQEVPVFAEIDFGRWEGLTFAEAQRAHPEEVAAWLGSLHVAPGGGGESFQQVADRVLAGLDEVVAAHPGGTVVLVSHVTPIKVLVAHALGAPLEALFRMELAPASVSVVTVWPSPTLGERGATSLRGFNAVPGDAPFTRR